MARCTFLPLLVAIGSASCTFSDLEDGLDAMFGQPTDSSKGKQSPAITQVVCQKNLASDTGDAPNTDPNLINAWGLAFNTNGPAWVSDNGTGMSSVFDPNGRLLFSVTIPTVEGTEGPAAPTGQVFNPDPKRFAGDRFIVVTEDGTIAGWQPGFEGNAVLRADNSGTGAVYKGVALAQSGNDVRLLATDFFHAKVDVFDSNYMPSASCSGGFVDSTLPPNYAPFNVFTTNDLVFVSYALQELPDKEDDDKGPGHGFINVFDADGHMLERLVSNGELNSPWGMAVAPEGFGRIPGTLLVGNFGDGRILSYKLTLQGLNLTASFQGSLGDSPKHVLMIDGLWAIAFPPNAGGFNPTHLYFTAGPDDEKHGLFGRLEPVQQH